MSKFDIMETTVAKVQAAYLDGTLTCRELCEDYLARIKAYDHEGPAINSIICVNPKALEEADAFDAYVKEHHALCGPLHGIPKQALSFWQRPTCMSSPSGARPSAR